MSEVTASRPPRIDPRRRWWVLLTVMVGTIASIMSSTIVNVAIPEISQVFSVGQERAQWLTTGFMAAVTLSMLMTPWLLGRFGFRYTYFGSVLVLMLGGIGGGLGTSFDWVLAMRVVEGLATGVIQPIPAIVILRAFGRTEQGRAMGVFSTGVVLAPAVGPAIGGLLIEHFGWRSIFFIVIPFCLPAMFLARRFLPIRATDGAAGSEAKGANGASESSESSRAPRLDLVGLALVSIALLALLNGLVGLHDAAPGRLPAAALALFGIALVLTLVFVFQQRRAAQPLINPLLFRDRSFAAGSVVAFIYGMGLFGSTYLVPVFMQLGLHLPPSQAGAVLLPAGIVLALTIPLAGRLSDRVARHLLIMVGLGLLAGSFALMLGVGAGTALWLIALWTAIGRLGLGFVLPSLNLAAMQDIRPPLIPQGASAISFMRQLGGAVGVNLIGIFLEWRLRSHGVSAIETAVAGTALPAFHEAFAFIAILTGLAAVTARAMKPRPPSRAGPEASVSGPLWGAGPGSD